MIPETHQMAGALRCERWPPEEAQALVSFEVRGDPKPAGSKVSGVVTRWDPVAQKRVAVERPGGGFRTFTKDSAGQAGQDWRGDLRNACADALDVAHELFDGPLAVRVTFFGARPRGHFGTGRNDGVLKATADRFPHRGKLSDGTKLTRALEDALTRVVWTDDRRIVDLWWSRRFGEPGARVDIFKLPTMASQPSPAAQPMLLVEGGSDRYHAGYGNDGIEALAS